jgi:hypothetical protein
LATFLLWWSEGRSMRWSRERRTRRCGCKRARGVRGPPDGQVPPSPAHGSYGAHGSCRGWARHAREREARCGRGGGSRPGRFRGAGRKGGADPSKRN